MVDSVKKAFILSAKALKLFYVIAVANIIANVINVLAIPAPVGAEMTAGRSFLVMALTILFFLLAIFITSGALTYIKELIKTGTANITSFIDNAKKYFLRLLGITFFTLLLFFILGILLFTILGFVPAALKVILTILAFVAVIVFLMMIPYALVVEDLGVIASIKKGILVGKKHFLKILGIIAIMFGVAIVVIVAASIIIGILTVILRPMASFIAAIIMAVANAVMVILVNITYMDFYLKNASTENK